MPTATERLLEALGLGRPGPKVTLQPSPAAVATPPTTTTEAGNTLTIGTVTANVEATIERLRTRGRVTRYDVRAMPSEVATSLDVDRVADIIRGAQEGDLEGLFALYRDIIMTHSHLQGRFSERKEAVVGDALNVQAFKKGAALDVFAAKVIDDQIRTLPSWEEAMLHLLDSSLYPVAVAEKVFRASYKLFEGQLIRYELAELVPVPHELLDFRDGCLKLRVTGEDGRPTGKTVEIDPARYIIHRGHTLSMPDNWGGPLRSLVFWWLLGTMTREWWARFLDKYGTPFLVGKYDQADDQSRTILERAFNLSTKLGGLVVSRETDVEIKQAAASDSGQAFETFHRICNEEISKLILGQTLSSDAKGTGMGSGVASAQNEVRQDKRQADARRLGATLRFQLFEQILVYNGIAGRAPMVIWGAVSIEEQKATADWLNSLKQGGLRVADSGLETLSERFGLPIERDPAPAYPGMQGGDLGAGAPLPESEEATQALGAAVGLNGAQIQAALRVVEGIKAGSLSKPGGVELLKSIGIPDATAQIMADTGTASVVPMSVQLHSASGGLVRTQAANQAILRTGGARIAQALGKTYAPIEGILATSATPEEFLERLETFCATLDAVTAAEIMEQSLVAFAANGSAERAR